MRQEFSRKITVSAPTAEIWPVLLDFRTVASWVSIVGGVEEQVPLERYSALLEDRLGPFKLRADLDVRVTDHEPGRRISIAAAGEDRQVASRIAVSATVGTEPAASGTALSVTGHYEVTGRVATLGAGSIRKKGDKMLDEFFAAAERRLGEAGC
jgi:carbon monoxide dehydrogenase subunit G